MIYADNAASTCLTQPVFDAMIPWLTEQYGNPSSQHSMGQAAKEAIENARKTIADIFNCKPTSIIFTSGATEANYLGIVGSFRNLKPENRQRFNVIVSEIEHDSVMKPIKKLEGYGYHVDMCPTFRDGTVNTEWFKNSSYRGRTKLLSVMAANNEVGTVQPIPLLSQICGRRDIMFHCDATQAIGHTADFTLIPKYVDLMTASAHKFHGPKGVGFLYVANPTWITSVIGPGSQEFGKRPGTENVAGIVGMAAALQDTVDNLDDNITEINRLTQLLKEDIQQEVPEAVFNGSERNHLPGLVSVTIPGVSAESIVLMLDNFGICISSGSACHAADKSTRVLQAVGLTEDEARSTIRISINEMNTRDEVKTIAKQLGACVSVLRMKR